MQIQRTDDQDRRLALIVLEDFLDFSIFNERVVEHFIPGSGWRIDAFH
jgi:hypothetical protein